MRALLRAVDAVEPGEKRGRQLNMLDGGTMGDKARRREQENARHVGKKRPVRSLHTTSPEESGTERAVLLCRLGEAAAD